MPNDEEYVPPEPRVPGPSSHREIEPELKEEKQKEPTPEVTNLVKTLENLNRKVDDNVHAARVVADPDVRAILEAKQRGIKVRVLTGDEAPQPQNTPLAESETPPDMESMTNAQLVSYLAKEMRKELSTTVEQVVTNRVKGLRDELSPAIQSAVNATKAQQSKAVSDDIASARSRFKDFEQMMPAMVKLNETVQGLNVEELYHMAKIRAGVPPVSQKEIETERPSTLPKPRGASGFKRPENIRGGSGFEALTRAAMARDDRSSEE